jgi:hypothetical protein
MTGTTTDMATSCDGDAASDDSGSASTEVISFVCGMLVFSNGISRPVSLCPQPTIAANYSIQSAEYSN